MSVDTMHKIVEQSKAFDPYKIMLFVSQGEPLLNKQLPQMIKLASDNDLAGRYEIISNGSLLTREYSDEMDVLDGKRGVLISKMEKLL
jgi:wyosine [tRNA(Phe)-imidazoG37] synthetase (radical SAM superfamily)